MRFCWKPVVGILGVAVLALAGCAPAIEPSEPARTPAGATPESPAATAETPPPATAEPTADPYPGWTTYVDPTFGVSFRYPSTWFGPDVYATEDGLRLEVGSDVVYPYGTGPDERQPGAPNTYSIVLQYTVNRGGWTLEQVQAEQPWVNDSLAVLQMQDGEVITTARSLTHRVRALTVDRFSGVEFITTLPDTAQTERVYMRTAFLMDEALNMLVIHGSPNNVEVPDPAAWRTAFEAVDAAHQAVFEELVTSIRVP